MGGKSGLFELSESGQAGRIGTDMKWIIESRWVRPGEQDERPIFLLRLGSKFEDKPGVAWTERKEDACQFVDKIIAQVVIDNLVKAKDLPIYPIAFLTEVNQKKLNPEVAIKELSYAFQKIDIAIAREKAIEASRQAQKAQFEFAEEDARRNMGDQELMVCPFCGGPGRKECRGADDAEISPGGYWSLVSSRRAVFFIECGDCGCYTREFSSEDLAIEAWNRRPQIDQVMGENLTEDADPRPTGHKSLDDYQAQLAAKQKRKC